jgi:hypothetical protein
MQNRPLIWSQPPVMFNNSKLWTHDYAKARTLVEELYNPETKNRSELIINRLKDNPEVIVHEVQKILENDLKKVKDKLAGVIDQFKQVRFPSAVKPGDKIMTKTEVIRKLKADFERKKTLKTNDYKSPEDLTAFELADKYEKLDAKKKTIKKIENEVLKEFSNLKIENNFPVFPVMNSIK